MTRQFFFILVCLTQLYSCSYLPGCSYFAEMENEQSDYFTPRKDFAVVVGDTGKDWDTEEEIQARVPKTNEEIAEQKETVRLHEELTQLESRQNSRAYDFYQRHKYKMASTSERIYFLSLPQNERRDYLENRGYLEVEPERVPASEVRFGLRMSDLNQGMSKEDVLESWGNPLKVEVAGNPSHENERWLYDVNGAMKYVYFESGYVAGLE